MLLIDSSCDTLSGIAVCHSMPTVHSSQALDHNDKCFGKPVVSLTI